MNALKAVKNQVVADMAQFLMGYGFTPKEAFKESETFWNRHVKKLKSVLRY